jgi:hypothetical protein
MVSEEAGESREVFPASGPQEEDIMSAKKAINVKRAVWPEGGRPETAPEKVTMPEDKMIDEGLARVGKAINNFICLALNLGCCARCIDHDLDMVKSDVWKFVMDDAARGEAGPVYEDCGAHPQSGEDRAVSGNGRAL